MDTVSKSDHDAVVKERDELKAKLAAGDASRSRYSKVAEQLGVKPEFRDDLYELAGVADKADLDEPGMREHVKAHLASRPHYAVEKPTQVSRRDYSDPDWRAANRDKLVPGKFDLV